MCTMKSSCEEVQSVSMHVNNLNSCIRDMFLQNLVRFKVNRPCCVNFFLGSLILRCRNDNDDTLSLHRLFLSTK